MSNNNHRIYISPCPNDTFIFYAMLHKKVDCEGLSFEACFEDISMLNERAASGEVVDLIKVSHATLPLLAGKYRALSVGGAMGYGNGPVVVARSRDVDLSDCTIAVPGLNTTANLLLNRLIPHNRYRVREYLFSDIARAVSRGEVDAGVLIHEGRFTYRQAGLELLHDLGELWEERFQLPVPLGLIVANPLVDSAKVERIISRSIAYAFDHRAQTESFCALHAAELSPEVLANHIDLFVNEFSLGHNPLGARAVRELLGV